MNYLQLVQRLVVEASMPGSGPVAVTGNTTKEYIRACNWVAQADLEIQSKYDDWRFLWSQFSFNTVVGQGAYTETEVVTASYKVKRYDRTSLRYFLTSAGASTEQWMESRDWEDFYPFWRNGGMRTAQGAPSVWACRPDRSLELGYVPNDVYTITGQYWRRPTLMVANGDAPPYPEEYHLLPVWWALVNYGGFEQDSFIYQHAQNMLGRLWGGMEINERPALNLWSAIA